MRESPGMVILFGSGEVSAEAQPIHDFALRQVDPPIRAAIVETPAGFEPNSAQVSSRLADYLRVHLQNYRPDLTVVPARRRGTEFSPDDPAIVAPLLTANYIMMGPGSPTYAARQLTGSLAWHTIVARHRLGCPLVFASAATIASSRHALPVYEIYKVGEDPHWKAGLDLFGPFGANIAFVPHWNNRDGGDDLDTSRCFLGESRFDDLRSQLADDVFVVGIDEKTALVVDFANDVCRVQGSGSVTIMYRDKTQLFERHETFKPSLLEFTQLSDPAIGLPPDVWEAAVAADTRDAKEPEPTPEVRELLEARTAARANRDWATADRLRDEIRELGWKIMDGPDGAQLVPSE